MANEVNKAEAKMVVNNCVRTPEGRALLTYFIDQGTTYSFTTDPIMNAYLEGKRVHGRVFLDVLRENHPHLLEDILNKKGE